MACACGHTHSQLCMWQPDVVRVAHYVMKWTFDQVLAVAAVALKGANDSANDISGPSSRGASIAALAGSVHAVNRVRPLSCRSFKHLQHVSHMRTWASLQDLGVRR